jgi:predicted PurR-regulated permease PerM
MRHERTPASELVRSSVVRTVSVLAVALLAWILWHARLALFVTAVSALLAVALDRPICAMTRRGLPRAAGIAIVLAVWAAVIVGLGIVFALPALNQLQQLLVSAPELFERLRATELYAWLVRYVPESKLQSVVPERAGDVFSSVIGAATGVLGAVAGIVTVFFITAFMLASGRPLISAWMDAAAPDMHARYARLLDGLYEAIGGYVTGLAVIVAIHATATTTFLGIADVPWFLALGLMAGLSSVVPYVGVLVAGAILVAVAALSAGLWTALATLAWIIVYQQIENHIVSPLVYRRALDVNPLLLLVAALVLGEVWGIGGAVLSVPIIAVGQIVLVEVLRFRRERGAERTAAVADVKQIDNSKAR